MASRIAHANIRVTDPAASVAFYQRLGLELAGCLTIRPGYALLYLSAPDQPEVTLELVVNTTVGADYDRSPGSGHIALAVGELDALLKRLAEAGVFPQSPPFCPVEGKDLRVCFIKDPDGTLVELIDGSFPTPSDPIPAGLLA